MSDWAAAAILYCFRNMEEDGEIVLLEFTKNLLSLLRLYEMD
jgi:hypothetical protein